MKRRIIVMLMCMVLMISILPVTALAVYVVDSGKCGENLTWTLTEYGVLTISGEGDMYDYYDENPDWDEWYYESIVIEEGVTSIGAWTFSFSRVKNITISDSVTSIGEYAFYACESLTSIDIPYGVTYIGDYAFMDCYNLVDCVLPDSVEHIGEGVFDGTPYGSDYGDSNITSGECGDNLTWNIDENNVLTISGEGDMWDYYDQTPDWRNAYYESVVIEEGITSIGAWALAYQHDVLTGISIPDSVTTIGEGAFYSSYGLYEIHIPAGVKEIGNNAFGDCSELQTITVDDNNTAFICDENGVLYTRDKTQLIKLPTACPVDEERTFIVPDGVTTIHNSAFSYCWTAQKIIIPASVVNIGSSAFSSCHNIDKFVVDEENQNYSSDENGALFNKDKTELIKVPAITDSSYEIPDSVEIIRTEAFHCCQVEKVIIPANVTDIETYVFRECQHLAEFMVAEDNQNYSSEDGILYNKNKTELVYVPSPYRVEMLTISPAVTNISESAFCSAFGDENLIIKFTGNAPTSDIENIFWSSVIAYYPENNETWTEETMLSLGADAVWFPYDASDPDAPLPDFTGECGENLTWTLTNDGILTVSGEGEMWDYSGDEVIIPNYLTGRVNEIIIEEGVTSIGDYAFNNISNVESVYIPASVTEIGETPFLYCLNLGGFIVAEDNQNYASDDYGVLFNKDMTILMRAPEGMFDNYEIPEGVENIKTLAFADCVNLNGVIIPASVSDIEIRAFVGCLNMHRGIAVNEDNQYYCAENGVLYNNDKTALIYCPSGMIGNFTVPESVTSIHVHAFNDSGHLSNIRFTGDAPIIEPYAFLWCHATIYYPETNETWTEDVLQSYEGDISWVGYDPENTDFNKYGVCGENLTWTLTFDGELTVSGEGEMWDYDYNSEDEIEDNDHPEWYEDYYKIKSIVIEEGVTSIGNYAFADCEGLASVTIPGNVKRIGNYAFVYCMNLYEVTIEDGVTSIGQGAFWNDFYIEEIFIPASVSEIGLAAFGACESINEFVVDEDNEYFTTDSSGAIISKDESTLIMIPMAWDSYTVPTSIETVVMTAFADCYHLNELTFVGDAPSFEEDVFKFMSLTVYYPANNPTWTEEVMQSYGSEDITWLPYAPARTPGDVDGDGRLTNADLVKIARYIVNLYDEYLTAIEQYGDMDGDGSIRNTDLVKIARIIVGLD